MKRKMRNAFTFMVVPLVLSFLGVTTEAKDKKLKPEELVALHLESLGPPEIRAERASCMARGQVKFEVKTSSRGLLYGSSAFFSEGAKRRMSMVFGTTEYPGEEMAFDGETVQVGQLKPGLRSALGKFLYSFNEIVTEGLFGGTLSPDWALQDLESRDPKLKYDGLKKVEDVKYHTLKYERRKGWDTTTKLYFDTETFRHCHTIYRVRQGAPMVHNPNASVGLEDTVYILRESFSEFRDVGGVTLPTQWILEHTLELGPRRGNIIQFTTNFAELQNNVEFDASVFHLDLNAY